ncbi:MAG: hypothetical protein QF731_10875, partial [Verrucomicrobiota bacterium]|nr:hypothetical protein [Verrucomicrobiota bacterium]
ILQMLQSISKPISIFQKYLNQFQNQYQYFTNASINFKTNINISKILESISKPISIFQKYLNQFQNQYQYFKNT